MDSKETWSARGSIKYRNQQYVRWETFRKTMAIDEIAAFALQMQKAGTAYRIPFLVAWGERLQSQASLFEMDVLPQTLAEFPEIIRSLQSLIQT